MTLLQAFTLFVALAVNVPLAFNLTLLLLGRRTGVSLLHVIVGCLVGVACALAFTGVR